MQLDEKLYHLCRLEITNVDSADAGCYRAVAKNPSGEGQATINLTFEEGKTIKMIKCMITICFSKYTNGNIVFISQ